MLLKRLRSRFALGGLSMDGIVAVEIAGKAPERVERLELLDTNHCADAPERRPPATGRCGRRARAGSER